MAATLLKIYPNWLWDRNRNQNEFCSAYVSADAETVTDMTKVGITGVYATSGFTIDETNDEIDLPANSLFKITVRLSQTGASSKFEIYNVTGSAVIATSATGSGEKTLVAIVKTTTAISISIRVDDQTANVILATDPNLIVVERIGKVQL